MWNGRIHPAAPPAHSRFGPVAFGPALPFIAAATAVIGTGISAMGAMQSAQAQRQASDYQAAVATNNAKTAQANADYALSAGQSQQESQAMSTRALLGNEKAAQASSGLDVNSGSSVDVRSSAAALGELSVLNIGSNAALRAANYRAQSGSFQAQSALDTMTGANASIAGALSAAGDIAGGAGSVASAGYKNTVLTGSMFGTTPLASMANQTIVH